MITLVKANSAHPLVGGSVDNIVVSVALAPQATPLEYTFTSTTDANAFVARLTAPDGEAYARSLASYKEDR